MPEPVQKPKVPDPEKERDKRPDPALQDPKDLREENRTKGGSTSG